MSTDYIHGFTDSEQQRLTRMQQILNERQLQTLPLTGVERVLDVGSGLGQMTRAIARSLTAEAFVVGVERSEAQLAEAKRQARAEQEQHLVEFRQGDAMDLPLSTAEQGSFDLVHTRFVLEHVPDPLTVVRQMVSAAKIGGQIYLLDDDHDLLRMSPSCPELERAWRIYWQSYREFGMDPLVGRRLPELLQLAGAEVCLVDSLFYGAVNGQPMFAAVVDNLLGVIASSLDMLIEKRLLTQQEFERALQAAADWRKRAAATIWYSLPLAIGKRRN